GRDRPRSGGNLTWRRPVTERGSPGRTREKHEIRRRSAVREEDDWVFATAIRRVRRRRSAPMLSHHDRTELEKIERSLELSDPDLAAALRDGRRPKSRALRSALLIVFDITAVTLLVLGLVLPDPGVTLCGILALTGTVWTHVAR